MNNISVTVKNRLGAYYGYRTIDLEEDDQACGIVSPGGDQVLPLRDEALHSLGIEVLNPERSTMGNGNPIPITIDSPGNYVISTLHHESGNKWRIEFEASQNKLYKTSEVQTTKPPVNVTVGQDEPDGSTLSIKTKILIFSGFSSGAAFGLTQISNILGIGFSAVLILGGFINWFIERKKNLKSDVVSKTV